MKWFVYFSNKKRHTESHVHQSYGEWIECIMGDWRKRALIVHTVFSMDFGATVPYFGFSCSHTHTYIYIEIQRHKRSLLRYKKKWMCSSRHYRFQIPSYIFENGWMCVYTYSYISIYIYIHYIVIKTPGIWVKYVPLSPFSLFPATICIHGISYLSCMIVLQEQCIPLNLTIHTLVYFQLYAMYTYTHTHIYH